MFETALKVAATAAVGGAVGFVAVPLGLTALGLVRRVLLQVVSSQGFRLQDGSQQEVIWLDSRVSLWEELQPLL